MRRNGERPSHRPDNPPRKVEGASRTIFYRHAPVSHERERKLHLFNRDDNLVDRRIFFFGDIEDNDIAAGILEAVHGYGGVCGCTVTEVPVETREINDVFLLVVRARLRSEEHTS